MIEVLKANKGVIGWTLTDLKGISPSNFMHKILMEDNYTLVVEPQRRLNPTIKKVVRKEVVKLLKVDIVYLIYNSQITQPYHYP